MNRIHVAAEIADVRTYFVGFFSRSGNKASGLSRLQWLLDIDSGTRWERIDDNTIVSTTPNKYIADEPFTHTFTLESARPGTFVNIEQGTEEKKPNAVLRTMCSGVIGACVPLSRSWSKEFATYIRQQKSLV